MRVYSLLLGPSALCLLAGTLGLGISSLFVASSLKDVIISGGENISSVEVEGVLLRHPAVQEVAVVGMPSEKWGESPNAFVVLRAGQTATEDELKQFVRDRLAHFKMPQQISFVTELPKTATGKIQSIRLQNLCLTRLARRVQCDQATSFME